MKSFNVTSMLVVLMFLCFTGIQAQTVTPSKKYITKELNNVSNFSSIRVLGSPDVEYRQSSDSKTTVSIYGSDNLVDLLEVSTVNGVLQVNIKKCVKILSGCLLYTSQSSYPHRSWHNHNMCYLRYVSILPTWISLPVRGYIPNVVS